MTKNQMISRPPSQKSVIKGRRSCSSALSFALLPLFFSLSALAHLPFLPAEVSSALPSADRALLQSVQARAQKENKNVILEVSAAWCGPCTHFAYDLENNPAKLAKITSMGFILVRGESEKFMLPSVLNDFIPQNLAYFPTFWIYSPQLGWMKAESFNDVDGLIQALPDYLKAPISVADWQTKLDAIGAAGGSPDNGTPDGDLLGHLIFGLATEYSYADGKAILGILASEGQKYPSLGISSDSLATVQDNVLNDYAAQGIPFSQLAHDFPSYNTDVTDVSSNNAIDPSQSPIYGLTLQATMRSQGAPAALAANASIWKSARSQYVAGSDDQASFQAMLTSFDGESQYLGLVLNVLATGSTPALATQVTNLKSSLQTNSYVPSEFWGLEAMVGQWTTAASDYHAAFNNYITNYQKNLADLNTKLAAAQKANDQGQVSDLQNEIKVQQFQIQYHTQVDADIEGAMQAGKPVSALKVWN